METNGKELHSYIEMSNVNYLFHDAEILPSSIGQFLFLNQLHAIKCHETLNALLMNPILLVEGVKT
jgi:hypothetical protein